MVFGVRMDFFNQKMKYHVSQIGVSPDFRHQKRMTGGQWVTGGEGGWFAGELHEGFYRSKWMGGTCLMRLDAAFRLSFFVQRVEVLCRFLPQGRNSIRHNLIGSPWYYIIICGSGFNICLENKGPFIIKNCDLQFCWTLGSRYDCSQEQSYKLAEWILEPFTCGLRCVDGFGGPCFCAADPVDFELFTSSFVWYGW